LHPFVLFHRRKGNFREREEKATPASIILLRYLPRYIEIKGKRGLHEEEGQRKNETRGLQSPNFQPSIIVHSRLMRGKRRKEKKTSPKESKEKTNGSIV